MDQSSDPTLRPPSNWRWMVCVMLLLATTLNYMDRMTLNQTSIRLSQSLNLNNIQYGYLESVFSLTFAVGTLAAGWMVDRFGVRWIYPLAVAGWSFAGLMTGFANSFVILLVCRAALGLFESANWPCGVRTIRQVMLPAERSFGNSLFQSGTAIGAIITPMIVLACLNLSTSGETDSSSWQLPFRIIGLIGFAWVVGWFFVPGRILKHEQINNSKSTSYGSIFRDRRFYILIAIIIGVNSSWHTFRIWLPKYLVIMEGYSETEMQKFSILYYVFADIGTWTIGLGTLFFAKCGYSLHSVRLVAFAGCTGLVLISIFVPLTHHHILLPYLLLTFGFGALGLFPTYFALSQELSAVHQGKVTGTLGFINAIYLAGMSAVQGQFIEASKRYDIALACAGVPSLIALLILLFFWRTSNRA